VVCTVLYPTYRTGVLCDWKPKTSCTWHFVLHGSIPCQGQTFFNSPKCPDGICGLTCSLLKGVSGAASLGNKAAAGRSEQLTVPSNVDVKNKWRYTTTPPHQSCTNFPRFKEPSKNSKHQSCDIKQVSYWGRTSNKFSYNCVPVVRDLFTPVLKTWGREASLCTEDPYLYYRTVSGRCQIYIGKSYFRFCCSRPWA